MKEIASVKMARRDHAAVEAHREQTNQATLKADEAYAKVNRPWIKCLSSYFHPESNSCSHEQNLQGPLHRQV